ncbi:MAG: relaxase/mobilization nuclease domain-containing protein, partial [Gammaproteobacteria bacterium]|nr:relaxase/mobilization nuclease domain-containing protein [Gammaproteobacteria bacterium]
MIVSFFAHGGGRSGGIGYLLGPKDHEGNEREVAPAVVKGNPTLTQNLINSNNFAKHYTSGVLSFAQEDQPSMGDKLTIIDSFEKDALFPGLSQDRYNTMWVEHQDKGRLELHFVVPNQELRTGKRLVPYFHRADLRRVDTWARLQRAGRDLADPHHPDRERSGAWSQRLPSERKEAAKLIHEYVREGVSAGAITDRTSLVADLKGLNFEIPREGRDYISVRAPGWDRSIRLKGGIYGRSFGIEKEAPGTERTERGASTPERGARTGSIGELGEQFGELVKAKAKHIGRLYGISDEYNLEPGWRDRFVPAVYSKQRDPGRSRDPADRPGDRSNRTAHGVGGTATSGQGRPDGDGELGQGTSSQSEVARERSTTVATDSPGGHEERDSHANSRPANGDIGLPGGISVDPATDGGATGKMAGRWRPHQAQSQRLPAGTPGAGDAGDLSIPPHSVGDRSGRPHRDNGPRIRQMAGLEDRRESTSRSAAGTADSGAPSRGDRLHQRERMGTIGRGIRGEGTVVGEGAAGLMREEHHNERVVGADPVDIQARRQLIRDSYPLPSLARDPAEHKRAWEQEQEQQRERDREVAEMRADVDSSELWQERQQQ